MQSERFRSPLLETLSRNPEVVTAGVIVCVFDVATIPDSLTSLIQQSSAPENLSSNQDVRELVQEIKIWIVQEKTAKPNEQVCLKKNLLTPPQETRRCGEWLQHTLAGVLTEELPHFSQSNSSGAEIFYLPKVSYLGHGWLPYPSSKAIASGQYRADYFLLGYSGPTDNGLPVDSEVSSTGWCTIKDYLDSTVNRRQGGAEVVNRTSSRMLQWLYYYYHHGGIGRDASSIQSLYDQRGLTDFKRKTVIEPTAQAAVEVDGFCRAS